MKFFSQSGQDQFLFEHFFLGQRGGVFVDVGAFDGEHFSNTLFFERVMGWRGLCIEPSAAAFARMALTRGVTCEQAAIADFEGTADFVEIDGSVEEKMQSGLAGRPETEPPAWPGIAPASAKTRQVAVLRLATLLEKHGLFDIDYCSIDVGGGGGGNVAARKGDAELGVLAGLDLERFRISVISIENHFNDERIAAVMTAKGYDLVAKIGRDSIFKRRDVKKLPQTSVICAVWHKDPKRWETLRGHVDNLAKQTVPVFPIYILDGGDQAPAWLEKDAGRVVVVREELTIYQAWNVALSLVATPLVMNLNLDDRLAPDAVALLEKAMQEKSVVVAGGEWHVRYSQEETDKVVAAYPADRLPFIPTWPPVPGSQTRLGSGTGERSTYGPATMWRMEAHRGVPRYPSRFEDGSLIRTIGDLVWWKMIEGRAGARLVHLPMVIGNYLSHPTEQAEFRNPAAEEMRLMREVGVSWM